MSGQKFDDLLEDIVERRNNGRNDTAVDPGHIYAPDLKNVLDKDRIFYLGLAGIGRKSGEEVSLLFIDNAHDDIGISDIKCKYHIFLLS